MMPPPEYPKMYQEKLEEISQYRRGLQAEYEEEYKTALVTVKDELLATTGPDMAEEMKNDIRKWFVKEQNENEGRLPDYPSDDEGGSAAIFDPNYKRELEAEEKKNNELSKKDTKKDMVANLE